MAICCNREPVHKLPPPVFPLDDFNACFPIFSKEGSGFTTAQIQMAGKRAMFHIAPFDTPGLPLMGEQRWYAIYLMTAHILTLNKKADEDVAAGEAPTGGVEFKATVGSVSVERTKPNSFTMDDWEYWLSQTVYGQELMSLLDTVSGLGFYLNGRPDSVRVLA